jgi:hypothetical protein
MERNMMLCKHLLGIILFCFVSSVSPTTINGRFTVLDITSTEFIVLLQVNTNTGNDDLGGATIVFGFDTTAISFPGNPIKDVDYIFHNFCDGNYSSATITRPMRNKIWVNIDLPFINNNNGTVVAVSPGWTDVVTIHFNIVDTNGTASLTWLTTSPFWGIYDADNTNLWQTGVFEDLFGPLPVELVSFTGTLHSNGDVLLEWKTASSLNNYGFEIEKSYLNSDLWETIGFLENQGDPSSFVEYSFTDRTLNNFPVARYRLKAIDYDGSFKYSNIIEINTLPMNYELSQNYPNPFNPITKIKFTIPYVIASGLPVGKAGTKQSQLVTLKVYDILGNEVATLVDEEKEPGIYEIEFSAANLASGIYIYRLQTMEFTETKKMVLLR